MNYELAKKLKDAGFPQNQKRGWSQDETGARCYVESGDIATTCGGYNPETGGLNIEVSVPTLSDLIEACGEDFIELRKDDTGYKLIKLWAAFGKNERGDGMTPEEATGNLWMKNWLRLKLNGKAKQ